MASFRNPQAPMLAPSQATKAFHMHVSSDDRNQDGFSEVIERILSAHQNRAECGIDSIDGMLGRASYAPGGALGPLTPPELLELSMLCAKQQSLLSRPSQMKASPMAAPTPLSNGFCGVDVETISCLIALLEKHVSVASRIDIIQEACNASRSSSGPKAAPIDEWLKPNGIGEARLGVLKLGLEASSTLLFIMASPGMDRRVISEDAIAACITLMRMNLSKNISPAISNSGHIMMMAGKSEVPTNEKPSTKKRRRSSGDGDGRIREMQKVYRHVLSWVGKQVVLMERITRLIQSVPLDDQALLTLTSGALTALELESAQSSSTSTVHNIQAAAVDMIAAVFRKYPRHREVIMEDIFPVMLRLPTSKKSLKNFPIRCSSKAFRPLARSLVTPPSPPDKTVDFIQALSALILSLIQSCVVRPAYQSSATDDNGDSQRNMILLSGVKDCHEISVKFAAELLKRCARKGEEGGASEFRPILSNLIDDLMLVLMNPAYPAAETLLVAFVQRLSYDLLNASSAKSGSASMESTYVATAFDALGKICSMEARILALHREKPLSKILPSEEDRKRIYCYCNKGDSIEDSSVACDRCDHWYHINCVGHTDDTVPELWICDACVLRIVVQNEVALRPGTKAISGIDEDFAIRKLVLEHLSKASSVGSTFRDAGEYQLARLVDECENLSKKVSSQRDTSSSTPPSSASCLEDTRWVCRRLLEQWDQQAEVVMPFSDRDILAMSDEGFFRSAISLASKCELVLAFASQLGLIVQLMSDESPPQLRKLALKAVEKVFQADSKLMLQPALMKAVSLKFSDPSISVREAAISIAGSYFVHLPAAADAFHSSLLPCLSDPGISVRKRTVRILQDILLSNISYSERASACSELLSRAADPKEDDGVRDLIYELFLQLWLEDGESAVIDQSVDTDVEATTIESKVLDIHYGPTSPAAEVVTPTPHKPPPNTESSVLSNPSTRRRSIGNLRQVCARTKVAAEQMVEVVKASGSCDNLTHLLRELLRDEADADKTRKTSERLRRQGAASKQCAQLCYVLFEMLVSVDERRNSFRQGFGKQLVAVMRTISMMAEFSPDSIRLHFETILPYLKADNGVSMDEESAIVCACCDILFQVTSQFNQHDVENLGSHSVGQDLINITFKFGSNALSGAVRSLSALAQRAASGESNLFGKKLFSLAKTFYGYLIKFKDSTSNFATFEQKTRNNVQRALNVLGSICRYVEVAPDAPEKIDVINEIVKTEHLSWSNLSDSCYGIFLLFLKKEDIETKCASLRALGRAIEANPKLLLAIESSGTIESIMSEGTHPEIQTEAICCWRDILLAEERRIESGIAKAQMDAKSGITVTHKISGDQDSEATIVGGVLTKYSPRLHDLTKSQNQRLRYVSLDLLGNLLRQGLVNPLQTVPHLLALQGDVDAPAIRALALKLLTTEGEKRPEMLRQRMRAGVKQAYLFQRSVYPERAQVSALVSLKKGKSVEVECIFGDIFTDCIASSKVQRQGLYKSLLSLFERRENERRVSQGGDSKEGSEAEARPAVDVSFLCFVAEILAHLPYSTALDPLFIIYHISSVAALQGDQLSDNLASFLRPYGLSSSDVFDESNAGEDALERASQSKTPSSHKEVTAMSDKAFKLKEFAELCGEAAAIVLLLRLKLFLRKAYNLTETRCLEYTPDTLDRPFDKNISKPEKMPRFNAAIPIAVAAGAKGKAFKDALIRQYAEFRRSMRSEANIGARMPSPDDIRNVSSKKKRARDS